MYDIEHLDEIISSSISVKLSPVALAFRPRLQTFQRGVKAASVKIQLHALAA